MRKECLICLKPFVAMSQFEKTCSIACEERSMDLLKKYPERLEKAKERIRMREKEELRLKGIRKRVCAVCGKEFEVPKKRGAARRIVCSYECRKTANKENIRMYRYKKEVHLKCAVPSCAESLISKEYYFNGKKVALCPNHRAIIMKGIKRLKDLIPETPTP